MGARSVVLSSGAEGLVRLDPDLGVVDRLTARDGLPADTVEAVLEPIDGGFDSTPPDQLVDAARRILEHVAS